jgi:hypothetical protein
MENYSTGIHVKALQNNFDVFFQGKKDDPKANHNYLFYTNQIESRPSGKTYFEIRKINLLRHTHVF